MLNTMGHFASAVSNLRSHSNLYSERKQLTNNKIFSSQFDLRDAVTSIQFLHLCCAPRDGLGCYLPLNPGQDKRKVGDKPRPVREHVYTLQLLLDTELRSAAGIIRLL